MGMYPGYLFSENLDEIYLVYMISSNNKYNCKGLREFGRRYAARMLGYLGY